MAKDQIFFGRRVLEEALKASIIPSQILFENVESERWAKDLLKSYRLKISLQSAPKRFQEPSSQGIGFSAKHDFYLDDLPEDWVERYPRILLCNHLEDIQNLGAIVRSAAAFGFDLVVHESRRSFRMNAGALRVSQGHAFRVKFYEQANLLNLTMSLQSNDYEVYALDASGDCMNLYEANKPERMALVVGSEAKGVAKPILNKVDFKLRIPMKKGFDSLNAAQAASIAMSYFTQAR